MDDEDKDRLKDIVNNLNKDVEMPPYNNSSKKSYSREYQKYQEEERVEDEKTRYERLCLKMGGLLNLKAGESSQEKLTPPLRLLNWDITPGMVLSAAVGVGFFSFLVWFGLFAANFGLGSVLGSPPIPLSIMFLLIIIPLGAGAYTYYKPVYAAKNKVIESSGEMILAVLYMVIYMRSSPNIEGAIRFAALNLDGPISKDLKGILWNVEVGKFNRIEESLADYTQTWKGYNNDFLESLQLLKAAVNEPNNNRRESLLQDSIDRILDGTQEKMKHYAQGLKTPVMILNAMGAMLPVLGMIMLPLVSVFMGGAITSTHLFLVFNILLPGFLYWFMQRVLSSRPPTVSSQPTSEKELPERGRYAFTLLGNELDIPTWPIGLGLFTLIGGFGVLGYISTFGIDGNWLLTYPANVDLNTVPSLFRNSDGLAPLPMLFRSMSITFGLGIGIGVSKILGNKKRKKAEDHLREIESQFPTALFQLGNKISGGTPIEVALEEAAESTSDLEISELFAYSSRNIREMGMTFEDAIFDPSYGALRKFPSQMIHTVMKAILESSEKGTKMASMAMVTISNYLDSIHKTQEQLNDLMEETTTTILMLAYLLAPVISGIAVGMSQTIITAMFRLSQGFNDSVGSVPSQTAGSGGLSEGILGNLNQAISPEILQFVVGIYLIQLLWILGTFYMKITHGENETYRNMFVGKVLISGMLFYSMTLIIVSVLFGGMVSGIT
jgi:Flp pilus assembly protein TadB